MTDSDTEDAVTDAAVDLLMARSPEVRNRYLCPLCDVELLCSRGEFGPIWAHAATCATLRAAVTRPTEEEVR